MQSKSKGKWTKDSVHYLTQTLAATWSPEQIEGRMKQDYPEQAVSFKTIYRWIYRGKLVQGNTILRHKGKRRKPRENRGRFNLGLSIRRRSKEVKPLVIGSSTLWFLAAVKVKVAWLLLSSEKHAITTL